MRSHTQTAGSTLTAQQPENNIVRTAVQAMAAVLGGTQSLHTNSFDEALGLPTEQAARLALRTQQILAYESGFTDTVDPLAGSYFIESLTDQLEERANRLLAEIEKRGGAVAAIESGWTQRQIEDSAYQAAQSQEKEEAIVVGVNRFVTEEPEAVPVLAVDPDLEADQRQRLLEWRSQRNNERIEQSLAQLRGAAAGMDNVLYPLRAALEAGATLGETAGALRTVFGTHRPA
jgi:methylmalonyl-CoA mutase N-terminal domain/subunit